jgi:hypothetical protein
LNYFSVVEIGLLSAFAILYNKDRPFGLLAPLTAAALVFTVFWFLLQYKHLRYSTFLHTKMYENIPEYRHTVDGYFGRKKGNNQPTAFSFSKPLSLAAPVLFGLTWTAFLIWIFINP